MADSAFRESVPMRVSILNAGGQTDYLYGLVSGLSSVNSLELEIIDSDRAVGVVDGFPRATVFNLRGDNRSPQSVWTKSRVIGRYYCRLLAYAVKTQSKLFHIQWENSLVIFDRTLLILFYKFLGKILVLTAHNIYKEARDGRDNIVRWLSLKCMYQMVDRIIVHTPRMKDELCSMFGISPAKVVVIPFGINNLVRRTGLTRDEARARLGVAANAKVALFFGLIDEYKGVETLVHAIEELVRRDPSYFLIVAGRPKRRSDYAPGLRELIAKKIPPANVLLQLTFIPENDVETFFAAADCLVLPYKRIFQSSVIFLSYRFGVPIVATDVGSFREDVVEGVTGFICEPDNPPAMAEKLAQFFSSSLFLERDQTRSHIIEYAEKRYSWFDIGRRTFEIYSSLLETP
jgi:D-inositol-3-phosphate glycosyltransferase